MKTAGQLQLQALGEISSIDEPQGKKIQLKSFTPEVNPHTSIEHTNRVQMIKS